MPSVYERVSARGFPTVGIPAGYTGAGARDSQGHPVDPSHGSPTTYMAKAPNVLPEFNAEPPGPVRTPLIEGAWGLPGGDLSGFDQTPRTHAAPSPGWAGSYAPSAELDQVHENSAEIHAQDFGALDNRWRSEDSEAKGMTQWETWKSNDPGESVQVPLEGAARSIGRQGDAVQGYDLRNRYGFDAGHRERLRPEPAMVVAYLDPSERPFIVPQASGSFTPTDAVQGPEPWQSLRAGENINATQTSSYEPPPEPPLAIGESPGRGAPASVGFWGS